VAAGAASEAEEAVVVDSTAVAGEAEAVVAAGNGHSSKR